MIYAPLSDGINKQSLTDLRKRESKGIFIFTFLEDKLITREKLPEKTSRERPLVPKNLLPSMQNWLNWVIEKL